MTLSLHVDTARWREHLRRFAESVENLVPVAKGNGYGFRNTTLATETQRLGINVIAVGIAREALRLLDAGWRGDIVVLNPWRPSDPVASSLLSNPQIISIVSRLDDLDALRCLAPQARVQVEIQTSMHRHGLPIAEISKLDLGPLIFEGWSVHLPATGSLTEATELARAAQQQREGQVWVSHLDVDAYSRFAASFHGLTRMRVGTRLWLGSSETVATLATVLDVHPINRGEAVGYHQFKVPSTGFIVVVSGGTAHGIALAAPTAQRSLRQRLKTVAQGALDASGRSLSPFTIGGKKRAFAEPPHMHSSMIHVPGSDPLVSVGDQVPVTCRMTTTTFDQIIWQ